MTMQSFEWVPTNESEPWIFWAHEPSIMVLVSNWQSWMKDAHEWDMNEGRWISSRRLDEKQKGRENFGVWQVVLEIFMWVQLFVRFFLVFMYIGRYPLSLNVHPSIKKHIKTVWNELEKVSCIKNKFLWEKQYTGRHIRVTGQHMYLIFKAWSFCLMCQLLMFKFGIYYSFLHGICEIVVYLFWHEICLNML